MVPPTMQRGPVSPVNTSREMYPLGIWVLPQMALVDEVYQRLLARIVMEHWECQQPRLSCCECRISLGGERAALSAAGWQRRARPWTATSSGRVRFTPAIRKTPPAMTPQFCDGNGRLATVLWSVDRS